MTGLEPLAFAAVGAKLGATATIAGWGFTSASTGAMVGMAAGGLLGAMLFPPKSQTHKMPPMASYPVQKVSKGTPIPIVFGTRKIAGNIVWMDDLISYQIEHKASGGKGGGGKTQSTFETRYKRSFLLLLCEGPAAVLRI